jgi:hypothetical protein
MRLDAGDRSFGRRWQAFVRHCFSCRPKTQYLSVTRSPGEVVSTKRRRRFALPAQFKNNYAATASSALGTAASASNGSPTK